MKIPTFIRRKRKLRATTARRSLAMPDADYEEMSEPNMKLSRALLIVLVLHVVAVSGIIAFNAIKTRQGPLPPLPAPKTTATKTADPPPVQAAATTAAKPQPEEAKATRVATQVVAKDDRKIETAKSAAKTSVPDSGKVYVVAKGDNPVSIARKLKVSYDDLLALNHIEDPHKLQIGQKLLVPGKSTKTKKADD